MLTLKKGDLVKLKYEMQYDTSFDQSVIPAGTTGKVVAVHNGFPETWFGNWLLTVSVPPHALELTDEPTEAEGYCLFDWDVFVMLAAVNAANFSWVSG